MKPTNFSIDHAVAVYVLILMVVVGGFLAYVSLPREAAPDVTIPLVVVSTPYYGVAPADIESLVTQPLERELKGLKDVDEITSSSAEGVSIITVKFQPKVVIDDALQKIREKVDAAEPDLPPDAEDSTITEINFSELPIILVNLYGEADQVLLKRVAEDLEEEFEGIQGVLDVVVTGGLEREIQVTVKPRQLEHYGLSLTDVINTLQRENVNLPGGSVDMGELSYLVRIDGEFKTVQPIRDLVIKEKGGQPIFIRDVADVVDGFKEPTTYSRFQGETNVSLSIQKRAGENLIRITDEVKSILAAYQRDTMPHGVKVAVTADNSKQIRSMVSDLENNILTGLILVVGVLFFFMGGARNSFFVGAAIPLSMLVSFVVLAVLGVTLNMVVLFSLVLALGMLVDNAIVVVENIYRHATSGKSRVDAARDGVAEVGWPVISSTATTVAAFAPMLFWPGVMGDFMGYLPLTVIIVLISSLFVALIINPVLCSTLLRVKLGTEGTSDEDVPDNFVYNFYRVSLEWSIRHRVIVMILATGALFGTFAAYGVLNHGIEFFPSVTPDRAFVIAKGPDGTRLEATDDMARHLEAMLMGKENVNNVVSEVGISGGGNPMAGGGASSPNTTRLVMEFPDTDDLVEDPDDTLNAIRAYTAKVAGAEFEVQTEGMGPPSGSPINLEIIGEDYQTLGELSRQIRDRIKKIEGVVDLKDDFVSGRPEIRVEVNRRQAALTGVSTSLIANTVRSAVNGTTATKIRDGEDEYDVVVRLEKRYRQSVDDISSLTVPGRDGAQVPLRELAELKTSGGTGTIRHVDLDRVVTIEANAADGYLADNLRKQITADLAEFSLPPGYSTRFTGEQQDQQESQEFLGRALLIALFLITLVLVTQFNSILQPMVIVGSVVLSLIGVLWGLILTGTPFGIIMVGIGIISLAGVVVNNAIVLIDYINQLRDRGYDREKAIVQAGLVRFRPVLLTAVTTVLGLVPMVIGVSVDFVNMRLIIGGKSVEMWSSMASTVTSGLIVATVLTLVMVPVMYSLADDVGRLFQRLADRFDSDPNTGSGGGDSQPGVQTGRLAGLFLLAVGGSVAIWFAFSPSAASAQEATAPAPPPIGEVTIPEVEIPSSRTLTLAQAQQEVVEANLDVKLSEERLVQAQTLQGQAWALLLPSVTLQGTYTRFDEEIAQPGIGVIRPQDQLVWQGTVQITVFNGQAIPLLRNAYIAEELEGLTGDQVKNQLVEVTTSTYYQLLALKRLRDIAETSLASQEVLYTAAKARFEAGAGTEFEVTRAEVEVIKARKELATNRLSWLTAREGLAVLLNSPPDFDVVEPGQPAEPPSAAELLEEAKRERADLNARRLQLESIDNEVDGTWWRYAPTLVARLNGTRQPSTAFNPQTFFWNFQLVATWELYDGGDREATLKANQSRSRQAALEIEKIERNLEAEVAQAYQEVDLKRLQIIASRQEVALAAKAFSQAADGYKVGAVPQIDVITSENSLSAARINLAREELDYQLAVSNLYRLVGHEAGGR
ncbi:MAG: hypothetical protein CMH57_11690 [Myxococcales bacterium]|nr:hypothetical protein [Myxococcales bacterium]